MGFLIMLIISLFFTPTVVSQHYDNNAVNNAKERSAELIVSSVRTAYASSYMKSMGMEPALEDIKDNLQDSLEKATVSLEDKKLILVTANGINCIFTIDNDNILKLSNSCEGFYKDTSVEIGKVTIK